MITDDAGEVQLTDSCPSTYVASYLYLNDARPSTKKALEACDDYDQFKYGMQGIDTNQSYAPSTTTVSQIWATYVSNNVHLALGLADEGSGDLGCEGLVQGESHCEYFHAFILRVRLALIVYAFHTVDRGLGYMNFVQRWAGSLPSKHTIE